MFHKDYSHLSFVLCSPVILELGQHDPGSFHANVDLLQAEGEGVCKLHSRDHLLIHFAFT